MINLTNYSDHPVRVGYTVFKFYEKERAVYFKTLLEKDNIWFESSEENEEQYIHFFGIRKADHKKALHKNYLVSAKYRKRIIANRYLGWAIIIISMLLITLAIVGAIKT